MVIVSLPSLDSQMQWAYYQGERREVVYLSQPGGLVEGDAKKGSCSLPDGLL